MSAAAIRRARPVVHCVTNLVTIGRVADALAALGALPVMAGAPEEAGAVAARAQALMLNLGTPDAARWAAARTAAEAARAHGVPVVVDPVGCGASAWRTEMARALCRAVPPDVVRANAAEMAALANLAAPEGVALRGVSADRQGAPHARHAYLDSAAQLARDASALLAATVVVTGPVDVVCAPGGDVQEHGGEVPALAGLIGAGDVLTAVIAAHRAVENDSEQAALAGLHTFADAARRAARKGTGPGTFWPQLMDALAGAT